MQNSGMNVLSRSGFPRRQVHLDFHTSPAIGDVGVDFDAREFARIMKAAHVASVTVFAKCHHGHLYYNTKRPERHPGLAPGLNLLGEQIEALHRVGIRAPIYISVQCDEYAANLHPAWVARNPDSSQVKWAPTADKVFGAGWQILDMATDYQEFLAEQTAEVLKRFKPADGIFFDMCWNQPSTTAPFIAQMIAQNLNPENADDRLAYAHRLALGYMRRFFDMVKGSSRDATVYFNGRKYNNLAEEHPFQTQIEIEALPTGGWGYMYFPKNVRFARTFGDKPYMGMTARFHKSWADFGGLKPYAALEYETSQMMAHGAACSIGDQLHPRGTLDTAAYQLIGQVYERVATREPWLHDAAPVTEIGLFQSAFELGHSNALAGSDEGATRLLTQLRMQFDVVVPESDLSRYPLLVLPDSMQIDTALARKLTQYVKGGGTLLASGFSGLSADGKSRVLPVLPIKPAGLSPFKETYIRVGREIGTDVPPTDHVMYEPGVRVTVEKGAKAVARVVEPYFNRAWDHFSSHHQTPPDKVSRYAAAVLTDRVAYIAYPIFSAYAKHGNVPYRLLVRNLLEQLLPEPLLRVDAPSGCEATVMHQPADTARPARSIIHLLHYTPERRTPDLDLVEDIVPLYDVPVSLRSDRAPRRVYLAPDNIDIPHEHLHGRINFRVPVVAGHGMVVVDEVSRHSPRQLYQDD